MIGTYVKKPTTVLAMQFNRMEINDLKAFVGDCLVARDNSPLTGAQKQYYVIKTLEGDMRVNEGDYIIKGIKGEFYPCNKEIFEETYEKLNGN